MGIENSKVQYSGEGEDFAKYLSGLKQVADQTEWKPGLVINIDDYDPLISIMIGGEYTPPLPPDCYTHILRAKHEDGSVNVIYLKKVTKKEAKHFKKIRKPPVPPKLPNFKYPNKKMSKGETIAEKASDESVGSDSANSILSAIDDAQTSAADDTSKDTPEEKDNRADVVNV